MGILLQLRFPTLAVVTVSLPLLSFIFCVVWSLLYNFTASTSTHCQVKNFLPSISAAIGGYTPQRYIWRIGIALHAAPRFLVAAMYYTHYSNLLQNESHWQRLAVFACVLHGIEIACLVGLTYISSIENFPAHEKFFATFMICTIIYMVLSCLLPRLACKRPLTEMEQYSLYIKSILAIVCAVSILIAVYFYFRHNWYCEPGVYTLFALCEYIVVLSNMGFHMTAFWDFADQSLTVGHLPEWNKYKKIHYTSRLPL